MKKTVRILALLSVLSIIIIIAGCDKGKKILVTFVNQTELPVNMFVAGNYCSNENVVLESGMRKENIWMEGDKNSEEFEVAVNNHVLVRKVLEWEKETREIMVVYNGSDLIISN